MDKLLKYPPIVGVSLVVLASVIASFFLVMISVYIKVHPPFLIGGLVIVVSSFVVVKYFLFDKGRNNE